MALDRKKTFFLKLGLGTAAFAAVINLLDWNAIWDVAGLTISAFDLWVLAFYIVARDWRRHQLLFYRRGRHHRRTGPFIPRTVQGIGVREAAFPALFALVGQDPASGFVISTVCFRAAECGYPDHRACALPAYRQQPRNCLGAMVDGCVIIRQSQGFGM